MAEPLSSSSIEFGARVRARRHELGWTQEELSEVSELHWTYIGQVERGERNTSLRNILKLVEALELQDSERGLLMDLTSW